MTARRYDLVLFDLDGTLADSLPWFCDTYPEAARRHGLPVVSPDAFEVLRGLGPRDILDRLGVPLWKVPLVAATMRRLAARDAGLIRPFEGAVDLVVGLAAEGVEVALVTSNSEDNARRILGAAAAASIRRWSCGAGLFGKARRFGKVVAASRVPAARVLSVGDELRDVEAARSIGIAAGAVVWGYGTRTALLGGAPDHVFETMAEVRRAVVGAAELP